MTETARRGMSVLELRTAPGDMGKIIGRQGRTAAALRTLLAVTAETARAARAARHTRLTVGACSTPESGADPRIRPIWDDMVLVGRVARPHGLRGHVVVNPETDFVEERFEPGAIVVDAGRRAATRALTVASARRAERPSHHRVRGSSRRGRGARSPVWSFACPRTRSCPSTPGALLRAPARRVRGGDRAGTEVGSSCV